MAKRILIVDDDQRLLNLYEGNLRAQGFIVSGEPDGERALEALKVEKPDLIILDIMLPQIHGLDILDIIKSTKDYQGIKIVVLTALSDDTTKQKAMELGASDYLVKSDVTMEEVLDSVKKNLLK